MTYYNTNHEQGTVLDKSRRKARNQEEVIFDFQKFPKSIFDSEIILNFTSTQTSEVVDYPARGIKGILITNSWTSDILPTGADSISKWDSIGLIDRTGIPNSLLPRLNLHATGVESAVSGGFTALFHGESGNIAIGPQCTWSQTHGTGVTPIYDASDSKYRTCLQLGTTNFTNISGSGGVTEEGIPVYYPIWDDNTDGNPWSGNLPRLSYELIVVGVTG
mgnify:CR=1 FL=1